MAVVEDLRIFEDGGVYFTTSPDSHEGRRILRGSPVRISTRSPEGPRFVGGTSIVIEPPLIERTGKAYGEKYWIAWLGLFRPRLNRVASGKTKGGRHKAPSRHKEVLVLTLYLPI